MPSHSTLVDLPVAKSIASALAVADQSSGHQPDDLDVFRVPRRSNSKAHVRHFLQLRTTWPLGVISSADDQAAPMHILGELRPEALASHRSGGGQAMPQ